MALELASLSDTDINPQSDALHSDSKPLLLVADDNPQMLEHLLTVLAPHYECITAANGADAVELARERVPDLIVSDVNMPKMDGFELTRLLKGDDRSCHIPIILLTARTDPESRRRGFEKHADIFMTKPFNPDELLQRIENLMGLLAVRRQGVTSRLFGSAEDLLAAAPEDCSARDQQFIEKLAGYLGENYKDPESTPAGMAESVAMSERQLQRKLKSLLNHTPAELLRLYRLEQARSQLLEGERPASVAFDVGFSSQAHFGACFKARYGDSPGSYADAKRQR